MTGNQIAYWQLQEAKRANLVNESIKADTLSETKRSNLINEGINRDKQASYDASVSSQITRNKVQNRKDTISTLVDSVTKISDSQTKRISALSNLIGVTG